MNVFVIGGGGREHALVWKMSRSKYVEQIFCAPGNAGISEFASCADIPVADIKELVRYAERNQIDLTVVGPELPLSLGIVDAFQKRQMPIFGPTRRAAEIESSKVYSKQMMAKYNIPTGAFFVFSDVKQALRHIQEHLPPFVIKADGLAEGKGVVICPNRDEAVTAVNRIMKKKVFGDAGKRILIEECLVGEEVSVLAMTDGENVVTLPAAQDHKAAFEGDEGPNTGGMGAYAPAPALKPELQDRVKREILIPMIRGLKAEGRTYRGVLYAGLMLTDEGPKVLEFNCRFGDPEIQAILPLIKTDIVDLMAEAADGKLKNKPVETWNKSAICVVMASGGYPGKYEKGKAIQGLDHVPADVQVFHAGTRFRNGDLVTNGGRVLGVTATGDTISAAIDRAYEAVGKITFDGAYYRKDIGHRALGR
jgi:phosphoribosylamine--glycine ligase